MNSREQSEYHFQLSECYRTCGGRDETGMDRTDERTGVENERKKE